MYAAVKELKSFARRGDVTVDNSVFQLHRKFTFLLLLFFCVVVTTNVFFGQTINCFTSVKDDIPEAVINSYCWVKSTFSLPAAMNKPVGTVVVYPGVDTYTDQEHTEHPVYHSYYQWVGFFLLFEALLFYSPYFIWKWMEGGKIKRLVTLTDLKNPISGNPLVTENNIHKLAKYLKATKGRYRWFAAGFVLCEALNCANVIGQIYFVDTFLGGEFTTFGLEVIKYSQMEQVNRTDPMIAVFPRVTKCGLNRVGVAGSIQRHDALCVLPMNMVNEKIFIFLWFWFIVLSVLSALALVYRLLLLVPPTRYRLVRWDFWYFEESESPEDSKYDAESTRQTLKEINKNYCEWFVLDLVRKNISSLNFADLVTEISRIIKDGNQQTNNDFEENSLIGT